MTMHMIHEVEKLKKKILCVCSKVEQNLEKAVLSVGKRDARLAKEVIQVDKEIDANEVEVEEECLKILALHQPVAIDLRYVIAILKINNDLERIGDLAVNIAEVGSFLSRAKPISFPFDFDTMQRKTKAMVKMSIDALVNMDLTTSKEVCQADDEVDAINREMYGQVHKEIMQGPENTESLIRLLSVSRNLERIADYATNIAEDVLYMIEGKIIRHRKITLDK
ncbi:phosphate signaling complex protein PhoU [bacterium]|nr:phosphate signaling complex protein PhoU [bacterium]